MPIGVVPTAGGGPALLDQTYVLGIAQGRNQTYQSGITAHSGGTQAAAVQLVPGASMYEVDTVAADADSIKLFAAIPGHTITILNAGGHTLDVYAYDGYNGATASTAADKINNNSNATAYQLTTFQCADFFCAKAGVWLAQKTA
jgi:hypothetical protein